MAMLSRPIRLAFPSAFECGSGVAPKTGAWIKDQGLGRVLIIADAFNADRVDCLAIQASCTIFDALKGEPAREDLDAALECARDLRPDVVIGFGGGSAMDLAKLVAVLFDSDQKLDDVIGPNLVNGRHCALVQVSTTSGTGSECGARALVTDHRNKRKLAVESSFMLADLAVIDPDLTMSVPASVTAATGIDALAHCVESFTNKNAHPTIDLYAAEGIRLVGAHLARAVQDGSDKEARMALSLASMYGGFCLGPVNTAAGHAVAYPLGTQHDLPHGLANALIFPYVLAFNTPACPEKTAFIMESLGCPLTGAPTSDAVFEGASAFCRSVGIEPGPDVLTLTPADLDSMADEAFAIKRLLDNNPRELSRDDIFVMYRHLAETVRP